MSGVHVNTTRLLSPCSSEILSESGRIYGYSAWHGGVITPHARGEPTVSQRRSGDVAKHSSLDRPLANLSATPHSDVYPLKFEGAATRSDSPQLLTRLSGTVLPMPSERVCSEIGSNGPRLYSKLSNFINAKHPVYTT